MTDARDLKEEGAEARQGNKPAAYRAARAVAPGMKDSETCYISTRGVHKYDNKRTYTKRVQT